MKVSANLLATYIRVGKQWHPWWHLLLDMTSAQIPTDVAVRVLAADGNCSMLPDDEQAGNVWEPGGEPVATGVRQVSQLMQDRCLEEASLHRNPYALQQMHHKRHLVIRWQGLLSPHEVGTRGEVPHIDSLQPVLIYLGEVTVGHQHKARRRLVW